MSPLNIILNDGCQEGRPKTQVSKTASFGPRAPKQQFFGLFVFYVFLVFLFRTCLFFFINRFNYVYFSGN